MLDKELRQAVDDFISCTNRAFSGEDVDPFGAFHQDITWTMTGNTPISRTYRGLGDIRDNLGPRMAAQFKTGPGYGIYPYQYISEGNRIVVLAKARGQGANGRPYRNSYFFLFEIKDGKIYRAVECYDGSHVMMCPFDMHLEESPFPS
jgi:ketosteroid isomerase-like protein